MNDLVVWNARLLATQSEAGEIEGGWVAIAGGLVTTVGDRRTPRRRPGRRSARPAAWSRRG